MEAEAQKLLKNTLKNIKLLNNILILSKLALLIIY